MPFELRPEPEATLRPEGEYLQRSWKQSILPMAEQMGVHMVLPRVSPQPHTHLAFEGYQFAKEHGKSQAYNHRMFTAFFQEEQDIGDIAVLTRLAGEIGLPENEFRQALESRKYKEVHQKALEHAFDDLQITAVPTFLIGESRLNGLYSEEMLERVIEMEVQKQQAEIPKGLICDSEGCD